MSSMTASATFESVEVGDRLPEMKKEVTREQITAYAEASGDHNPIHLDEEFARSVGLPGVIAHGMLTMAFLGQLVADWAGRRQQVRRLQARFAGMVLPGDTVTCTAEVVKKDSSSKRVTLNLGAVNQRGEKVITKALAEVEF
jgi:acyl dehydratase